MKHVVADAENWIPFSRRAKLHSLPAQFGRIRMLQQIFYAESTITPKVSIYHFCMFSHQSLLRKQYSLR